MLRSPIVGFFLLITLNANAQECAPGDELQVAETERDQLLASMLQEVDDHRYESCRTGSTCKTHLEGLEQQLDAVEAEISVLCESYLRWRDGLDGLVDPSMQPEGTLWQYTDDAARRELYTGLIAAQLSTTAADQTNPEVVLTMGAPGSGKSTVLRAIGLCQADVVLVDPDEFKRDLVEYQAGVAAHDRLSADRVHRESSMLAKATRDEAIATGRNMCIDGVMSKREQAVELLTRLRESGYTITIVAVTVPLDVSIERVQRRGEVTGRFVPRSYIELAYANIGEHREELLRLANHGLLYDANVPITEAPVLLAEYVNGEETPVQEN